MDQIDGRFEGRGRPVLSHSSALTGVGMAELSFPEDSEFDTHEHRAGYACLIVSGGYREWLPRGGPREVNAGSCVDYLAGSRHAVKTHSDGVRIFHVTRETDVPPIPDGHRAGFLWQLYRAFTEYVRYPHSTVEALHLDCLAAEATGSATTLTESDWLLEIMDRVRDEYHRRLTLGELASGVERHPAHLARAFRARWGMTVGEYLRRVRSAHAVHELRVTAKSLSMVATDAGFADQSHLGRWLRRYVALTPAQVRSGAIDGAAAA